MVLLTLRQLHCARQTSWNRRCEWKESVWLPRGQRTDLLATSSHNRYPCFLQGLPTPNPHASIEPAPPAQWRAQDWPGCGERTCVPTGKPSCEEWSGFWGSCPPLSSCPCRVGEHMQRKGPTCREKQSPAMRETQTDGTTVHLCKRRVLGPEDSAHLASAEQA